jgi:mannose-1-phosphate guanylyltransferase
MTSSGSEGNVFAVVMAGGAGTRFWPLSRRRRPKQLLPFADGRSLLAATVERLAPLVEPKHVLVVTNAEVVDAARADLPLVPPANVLAEPVGRDTAACIGWAAWRLASTDPEAVMIVLPADHVIRDAGALRAALGAAVDVATREGGLVTLGLKPTRPETGFGYLELGLSERQIDGHSVCRVRRFVEKPDRATAVHYLEAGNYRWNSGMFVWRVGAIQRAIREHLPGLADGLDALLGAVGALGEDEALLRHYPQLQKISIDFGVMEKAVEVRAIPVELAWSDVGSWLGLAEVLPESPTGVTLGDVVAIDSHGSVLVSDGPTVAVVGVRDLVVVATRDAVLVVPKEHAQRVKEVVNRLRELGRHDLI